MTRAKKTGRRKPPTIPDDAEEDRRPNPPIDTSPSRVVPVPDTPGKRHRRKLEKAKIRFAKWLIWVTLGIMVAIGAVSLWKTTETIDALMDTVKTIATIALGFVFGRISGDR